MLLSIIISTKKQKTTMKKITVNHFILAALFLALIVQVFNTSSLFMSYSNLQDPYKQIAGYFVGLSFEFSIFICIYAGSRSAGAFFAIITFFCGILYHNHWKEVVIDFDTSTFYFSTAFLSSTLIQFMNSVLAWFLSELYIEKQNIVQANQSLSKLKSELADLSFHISNKVSESKTINESISHDRILYNKMVNELAQWEQKRESLKQEISTLQKQKAGASKGQNVIEQ
jgi:hypothetical protein